MLRIEDLKSGDMVYCMKTYIETEFSRGYSSNEKYANGKKYLVHLRQGKQYKVLNGYGNQIEVKNEFGRHFYYNIDRFDKLKDIRRNKLNKLKKYNKNE